MPKFDLDINGVDVEAYDGFGVWDGPTPPSGVYSGRLKVAQIVVIDPEGKNRSKNAGKNRVKLGVELTDNKGEKAQYNGFTAWGGVNLVESGLGFVNQWLRGLTDGSDEEFIDIKKSFYEGGIRVDEKKEHITAIGRWKVESPDGQLPVVITIKQEPVTNQETKETRMRAQLQDFLVRDGESSAGGGVNEEPAEEPEEAELNLDDTESVGEDVFDAEDVPATTP